MIAAFTKINVYNRVRGGALVTWELTPQLRLTAPAVFSVEASRTGVADWNLVATVTNQYLANDNNQWQYGTAPRLHYRVVLTTGAETYVSPVRQILGNVVGRNRGIVSELLRKEQLRFQHSGRHGYLYKRRRWGVRCPDCVDYDTGEVRVSGCTTCLGTGFTGGYFDPVVYYVADSSAGVKRKAAVDEGIPGLAEARVKAVRAINCPWLDTEDIWIDCVTDERFYVQSIQEINYGMMPIIFDPVELRLATASDVAYTLSRPDESGSSSSTQG